MAGINSALEIAKNTLLDTQLLIQTASHNIANADNKAYARQKVVMATNHPEKGRGLFLGRGARVESIVQYRDQYLEQRLRNSTAMAARYETEAALLEQIGAYLSDTGESGVSQKLGDFFDSWDTLSQNPQGSVEREGVIAAATGLTQAIRDVSSNLSARDADIQSEIETRVVEINNLLSRIADYNREIVRMEISGQPANDLRDMRYQALADLAGLVQISAVEESSGSLTVTLTDGDEKITLVAYQNSGELRYDSTSHLLSYVDAEEQPFDPTENSIEGGKLSGLLNASEKVRDYLERLDTFAATLIEKVNTTHGTVAVFSGSAAADIAVAEDFKDPANIRADQALALSNLQQLRMEELGDSTFVNYLAGIQQQVGLDQSQAGSNATFYGSLSEELLAQQQSVSGVSIDEEMIDLLKFQQLYQAAARVVSVTQQMLSTAIEMVR